LTAGAEFNSGDVWARAANRAYGRRTDVIKIQNNGEGLPFISMKEQIARD
jgi:hypothetical protein